MKATFAWLQRTPGALRLRLILSLAGMLLIALPVLNLRPGSVQAQGSTTRFAVIGDYGCACQGELDTSNLIKSWNPDFIVTVGDNNYNFGEASTIDANIGQYYHDFIYPYPGSYGAGSDVNRFFPALGNHDWGDGYIYPATVQPYLDYFTLPGNERYYDFSWGPVHIFVVDSDNYEPDGNSSTSIQAIWLQSQLAASTAPWKIVFFHNPPYTSGASHGSTIGMQWPFESWGATAVLSGHEHVYERVTQGNFPYFVNGLGAGQKSSFKTPIPGSQVRYYSDYGAMLVTSNDESIKFQFVSRAGVLIDTYTIYSNPSGFSPAPPGNFTVMADCSTQIKLAWSDNSSNEDGFKIERSADGANFTEIATVPANVNTYLDTILSASTTYYYRVRAYNPMGDSDYTSPANAATTALSSDAPSNLTAATASSTRISLAWTDNVCSDDGFKIERSADGASFAEIATVPANVTTYTSIGLTPATLYYFRVRAHTAAGDSDYTNVASAMSGPPAPPAPSDLTAAAVSNSQINLAWVDNSTTEDDFRIYRSTNGVNFYWYYTVAANVTTYSDTGRAAATTYYYRVTALNTGGESVPSNTASATTLGAPAAPSNLTATAVSSTQINLSWTDNSSDEDGFKIYRATDGVNFAFYATVGANVTSRSNTNLTAGTPYYYRVLAYNAGGTSDYSNTASATTFSVPAAPSNLTATAVSSSRIDLSWTDNSSDETGFRIYRSTNGVNFTWYYSAAQNATTYSDTGRAGATTYYYRVTAQNSTGNSDFSNTASATTFGAPAAPSNLTATAVSSTQINLSWTDNSSDEDGFNIYRATDGVDFAFYTKVGKNVTTRSNTNLTPGTTYYYRVLAYNGGGTSNYSNTASATTLSVPAAPSNLTATAVSSKQVNLSWTDNSSDETGFRIYRSTNGVSFSWVATAGANVTTYSNIGRKASTTYYYRVTAQNANGNSDFSNTASATTLP